MSKYDPIPLYCFIIFNQMTHREIGNLIYHQNGTIDDFNAIAIMKQQLIMSIVPNQKGVISKVLSNHISIGMSIDGKTFYFAAIKKRNCYTGYKGVFCMLIEEIEHQGIMKMIMASGELSVIGMKNLRFSIEKFKENYTERNNKKYNARHYVTALTILIRKKKKLIKKTFENIIYDPLYDNQTNNNNLRNERMKLIRKVSYWIFIVLLFILYIYHTKFLYHQSEKKSN